MTVAEEIITLFANQGKSSYFGEPVSQLEHALQAAYFAQQEGAPAHLVVTALVHDIGHLLAAVPEDIADSGVDAKHEEIGESWLAERFGPEIHEPVRLHVAAKRYLCAKSEGYFEKLSPASVQSLSLQGGPMPEAEARDFQKHPFYKEALRLRLWDDRAKIAGLETPALSTYRELIGTVSASAAHRSH